MRRAEQARQRTSACATALSSRAIATATRKYDCRRRVPASPTYFFFAADLRADFFFAAGFFLAAFFAAFLAGFRFAVLANVLLLSMLSRESAHKIHSSPTSELTSC
jgi:hypothetical protein